MDIFILYACMYINIYIHTHASRQTDRHTYVCTCTRAHTHTHSYANTHTHTHTQVAVALVSPLILYKVLALATGEKVKAELDFAILASVLALVYKLVFK